MEDLKFEASLDYILSQQIHSLTHTNPLYHKNYLQTPS